MCPACGHKKCKDCKWLWDYYKGSLVNLDQEVIEELHTRIDALTVELERQKQTKGRGIKSLSGNFEDVGIIK